MCERIWYWVICALPGSVQVSLIWVSPGVARNPVGAAGGPTGVAVTLALAVPGVAP